jgi:hypothetical protein
VVLLLLLLLLLEYVYPTEEVQLRDRRIEWFCLKQQTLSPIKSKFSEKKWEVELYSNKHSEQHHKTD